MNTLDKKYQELLQDILDNGVKKEDRTGTGTLSVFGRQIRHKMSEGFPLLTTKKMYFKGIVTELLWFLRGDTNIKYLVDNNCHIWDGDAYKNYERRWETEGKFLSPPVNKFTKEEFINEIKTNPMVARELGELGPIYGKQWRKWKTSERRLKWSQLTEEQKLTVSKETLENTHPDVAFFTEERGIDQIANLINDLKTNPDSRRLMVSAWNPADLESSVLPPCHYGFQVYTRELSSQERKNIYDKSSWIKDVFPTDENGWNKLFNDYNIPTRAISLMWNQRSVDVPLGLPFNLASYGLLLQIIAKEVNMVPDELIASLGDAHIYVNQIDGVKEQLTREPYKLPTLVMVTNPELKFDEYVYDNFKLVNYESHPTIKMPLSN